jgi:hypothetical protein
MFPFAKEPTKLDNAIDRALSRLSDQEVGSEEYVKTLEAVTKLHKMKEDETPNRLSKDTLAIVSANLLGIMLIIRHEHVNVVTSKAMGLVIRPR